MKKGLREKYFFEQLVESIESEKGKVKALQMGGWAVLVCTDEFGRGSWEDGKESEPQTDKVTKVAEITDNAGILSIS